MLTSGARDVQVACLNQYMIYQQSTLLDSFDSIEIIQQSQGVSNKLEILEATLEIFDDYHKFMIFNFLLYIALEIFEAIFPCCGPLEQSI